MNLKVEINKENEEKKQVEKIEKGETQKKEILLQLWNL